MYIYIYYNDKINIYLVNINVILLIYDGLTLVSFLSLYYLGERKRRRRGKRKEERMRGGQSILNNIKNTSEMLNIQNKVIILFSLTEVKNLEVRLIYLRQVKYIKLNKIYIYLYIYIYKLNITRLRIRIRITSSINNKVTKIIYLLYSNI